MLNLILQVFTRLPAVISAVVTLVGALIIGFIFGWQLAFILLAIVPLLLGSGYFQMKMQVNLILRCFNRNFNKPFEAFINAVSLNVDTEEGKQKL